MQIQPVTKDIADSLDLGKPTGTIVSKTQSDSPAAKAGLKAGDVILSVNDTMIKGPKMLAREIANLDPEAVRENHDIAGRRKAGCERHIGQVAVIQTGCSDIE